MTWPERGPIKPIPGAREAGALTRFAVAVPPVAPAAADPSTMDAATIAGHEREGGGAPSERRPARG
jgi:hypothetical protein